MNSPGSHNPLSFGQSLTLTTADISEFILNDDAQYNDRDLGFRTGLSSILADLPSSLREGGEKISYGASGLLRSRSPKPLALNTLMTERQLHECGLHVVGQGDVQRWLVPLDASDLGYAPTAPDWFGGLVERISELKELANEEQLLFNEESAEQAIAFAGKLNGYRRPSAFLIGNGNVRLLWAGEGDEQIGLQFIGNGEVQYVLMVRRESRIASLMGADRIDSIMRYVNVAGLGQLFRQ